MARATQCAAKVLAELKEKNIRLSKGETEALLEQLELRMKRFGPNTGPLDPRWDQVAKELLDDIKIQAFAQRRNAKLNRIAAHRLDKLAEAAVKAGLSPAEARKAATVGSWHRFDGSAGTVDAMGRTMFASFFERADQELTNHPLGNLADEFKVTWRVDHEKQLDLARALQKETDPNYNGPMPSEKAQAAAKILTKYRRAAFKRRNRAGAYAKELDGFIGSQTHDGFKLGDRITKKGKAARDEWIKEIKGRLHERTFWEAGIDPADDDAVNEFLNEAASNIVSGRPTKSFKDEGIVFGGWQGEASLAKKVSERHRKLHFKSADDWYEYNKKYGGRQSVIESWVADLEAMTQETAIMEKFGPNAKATWDAWGARLQEQYGRDMSAADAEKMNDVLQNAYFDSIFPEARRTNSRWWANLEQAILTFNNIGKLPLVAVSSMTDFVFQGHAIRRLKGGGSTHVYTAVKKFVAGATKDEKEHIVRGLGVYREGMVAGMASRMDVQGEYSGLLSRVNNLFFKYNLLQGVTNRGKDGLAAIASNEIGEQAAKAFDDLPDYFKKIIGTAGIDKRRWEVMRKAVYKSSDGRSYMVGDMIRQLDDDLFDVKGSTPDREKDDIITALNVLVNDFVESGVPTPGLKERGQLSGWQQPGTPLGALVKILTQFKSFPMTVFNKVIMPHIMDKQMDGNMDRWGMVLLAGNSILLGGAVLAAKDAIKTREPEVLNIDSPAGAAKYAIQSLLQGGALGLYGDILMQDYSRYGSTVGEQLAGPTVSSFSRFLRETVSKPMRGEGDMAAWLRMVEDNTPGLTLPGVRPAFDYLVMYSLQEYLNPGYLRRMERYAENSGRPYIWSPSESVR